MLDPLMAIMVQVCVCAARGARRAAFKCQGKVPGCVSVRGCACVCAGDMVSRHPTPSRMQGNEGDSRYACVGSARRSARERQHGQTAG